MLAVVADPEAAVAEVLALLAEVDALLAWVLAVLAEPDAAVAEEAAAVALVEAAEADAAAFVALVAAVAASTNRDHFAESALVLIGCDPLDVCKVMHCQILLLVVSLTMSLT